MTTSLWNSVVKNPAQKLYTKWEISSAIASGSTADLIHITDKCLKLLSDDLHLADALFALITPMILTKDLDAMEKAADLMQSVVSFTRVINVDMCNKAANYWGLCINGIYVQKPEHAVDIATEEFNYAVDKIPPLAKEAAIFLVRASKHLREKGLDHAIAINERAALALNTDTNSNECRTKNLLGYAAELIGVDKERAATVVFNILKTVRTCPAHRAEAALFLINNNIDLSSNDQRNLSIILSDAASMDTGYSDATLVTAWNKHLTKVAKNNLDEAIIQSGIALVDQAPYHPFRQATLDIFKSCVESKAEQNIEKAIHLTVEAAENWDINREDEGNLPLEIYEKLLKRYAKENPVGAETLANFICDHECNAQIYYTTSNFLSAQIGPRQIQRTVHRPHACAAD